MAKQSKNHIHTKNQVEGQDVSQKMENIEKITKGPKKELAKDLEHISPIEAIEHIENKLLPIESGKVRYFNRTKGEGFITPNDGGKDIYVTDTERSLKDGEKVNYIQINHEALPVSKGIVKLKSGTDGEVGYRLLFVQPDSGEKDVVLYLKAQHISGQRYGYILDTKDFIPGDEVEYVANKKGEIVAIKKIEK